MIQPAINFGFVKLGKNNFLCCKSLAELLLLFAQHYDTFYSPVHQLE
jgi:hypothetical protein